MEAAQQDKVWLKSYPPGVPAEVDTSIYASVADLMEQAVRRFGDQPAYENFGAVLSYDELDRQSQDFASYLQNVLGMDKGDRIALMMPNLLQYPVALFGALRAGLVVVNVNPLYTPRELEHQLKDSGARAIVIVENFAHTLQMVLDKTELRHIITTQVGDLLPQPKRSLINFVLKRVRRQVPPWTLPGSITFRRALLRGRAQPCNRVTLTQQDLAFLQYTGGTTGLAKGAMLTHGNIVANVLQARAWIDPWIEEGKELIVTALPLYHIFALTANCLVFMSLGAHNVLITNPRDLPALVKEMGRHRITAFTGVNTLFNGLLNTPGFDQLDFSALRLTLGGGAAVQQAVADRWAKVTGKPLSEAYGLTETSPAACINPLDRPDWNGTIGLPIPSTEAAILDDAGQPLPVDERGELCIRGPQVMAGYWQRPDSDAETFTADGYLRTGDIATMDADGFFRIVDRKKDMILVSGFNVFPNEVEQVVAQLEGVVECACIGVPDDKTGEAVKVFVVRRDPALTAEQIRAHCKAELTAYKVPKHVEFRDELPKSNVGKILRKELR